MRRNQAQRDTMAQMAFALRKYLRAPECPNCRGTGYRCADMALDPTMAQRIVKCEHRREIDCGPTRLALEIVKNAWTPIIHGDSPALTILSLVYHRIKHGWLVCNAPRLAARAASRPFYQALDAGSVTIVTDF